MKFRNCTGVGDVEASPALNLQCHSTFFGCCQSVLDHSAVLAVQQPTHAMADTAGHRVKEKKTITT